MYDRSERKLSPSSLALLLSLILLFLLIHPRCYIYADAELQDIQHRSCLRISDGPYYADYSSQPHELEIWEQGCQSSPIRRDFFRCLYATRYNCNCSSTQPLKKYSIVCDYEHSPAILLGLNAIPVPQGNWWEEDKVQRIFL